MTHEAFSFNEFSGGSSSMLESVDGFLSNVMNKHYLVVFALLLILVIYVIWTLFKSAPAASESFANPSQMRKHMQTEHLSNDTEDLPEEPCALTGNPDEEAWNFLMSTAKSNEEPLANRKLSDNELSSIMAGN